MESPRRVDFTSFWTISDVSSNFACSGSDGGPVDGNVGGSSGSPTIGGTDGQGGADDATAALDHGRTAGCESRKQSSLHLAACVGRRNATTTASSDAIQNRVPRT